MGMWPVRAAVALALVAQVSTTSSLPRPDPSPAAIALAGADNQFGLDVLQRLHRAGTNTFISPASIGMALQMASRGASGQTLAEMRQAMHTARIDVAAANRELIPALASRDAVALKIANSVWVDQKRVTLEKAFASGIAADFHGEIFARDFADPGTTDAANQWISRQTAGKIPKMLDRISGDETALIVNAVYFKGEWSRKFDRTKTTDADFHPADGTNTRVPMMGGSGQYDYAETPDLQIVALPFGKDGEMRMWVALPRSRTGLDAFVRGLDLAKWHALADRASERKGTIRLPRFKMGFKAELTRTLADAGMKLAFTPRADFTKLGRSASGNLFLSRVLHEAVIEVNEEGAEAAAATAAGVTAVNVPPPPFEMICDRPFLLSIADRATGAILFIGTVYRPG